MTKLFGLAILLLLAYPYAAPAHQIDKSFTTVSFRPDSLKVMVAIDEADLLAFFNLDQNRDQLLQREELLAGIPQVFPVVEQHLQVAVDGRPAGLRRIKADVGAGGDGTSYLNFYLSAPLEDMPVDLDLQVDFFTGFSETHRNLATILVPGKPVIKGVFSREVTQQRFVVGERRSWWEELVRTAQGWLGQGQR
jgi:hypothetical protein